MCSSHGYSCSVFCRIMVAFTLLRSLITESYYCLQESTIHQKVAMPQQNLSLKVSYALKSLSNEEEMSILLLFDNKKGSLINSNLIENNLAHSVWKSLKKSQSMSYVYILSEQIVLPDSSISVGQKIMENAIIEKLRWDILVDFQTMCLLPFTF